MRHLLVLERPPHGQLNTRRRFAHPQRRVLVGEPDGSEGVGRPWRLGRRIKQCARQPHHETSAAENEGRARSRTWLRTVPADLPVSALVTVLPDSAAVLLE